MNEGMPEGLPSFDTMNDAEGRPGEVVARVESTIETTEPSLEDHQPEATMPVMPEVQDNDATHADVQQVEPDPITTEAIKTETQVDDGVPARKELMMNAGLLDTDPEMEERTNIDVLRRRVGEKLSGDEELDDNDYDNLNKIFVYIESRKEVLLKRDNALNMHRVTDKYEDFLSPETGIAFDHTSREDREQARGIYIKGKRVGTILEVGYDRMGVSSETLKESRDEIKEQMYKKGKKLGEVASMDKEGIKANRKELKESLDYFNYNNEQMTVIQRKAGLEYIRPENKITKKEMAQLNGICALGLVRREQHEAAKELDKRSRDVDAAMDKERRTLKRTNIVNNALDFLKRRFGRIETVKSMANSAKAAIKEKEEQSIKRYESLEGKQRDFRTNPNRVNVDEREVRRKINSYGSNKERKSLKEDREYAQEVKQRLELTLKDIKSRSESNLQKLVDSFNVGYLTGVLGIVGANVLAGVGVPVELIGIISLTAGAGTAMMEKGYQMYKRAKEKRVAYRNARQAIGDKFRLGLAAA